jgi:hypothetical protein
MLWPMEAVICLRPGAKLAETQAVLRRHGVTAEAMHPGVADELLSRWYVLNGPDDAALAAAIEALQSHPAVDAALLKPAGEPPG